MTRKDALRKEILELRSQIKDPSHQLKSALICENIISFLSEINWDVMHSYIPFRNEVDILPLLKKMYKEGKQIVSSITHDNRQLEHIEFDPNTTFASGKYGVPYPILHKAYSDKIDVILVPGVVYDHDGNRIGYGGGYYDHFLEKQKDALKIGVCFIEQIDMDLPHEDYDQRVDIVIND